MNKFCFKSLVILIGGMVLQNVNAASIDLGFDNIGNPTLDLFSLSSGGVLDSASITDWTLSYDDVTDTGVLSIAAASVKAGAITVNSTSLTVHANGRLHVEGTVGFVGTVVPAFSFVGDMVVDVITSDVDQTTIFILKPLALFEQNLPGFLLADFIEEEPSPPIGDAFNFQLTSSFVAIVDSPFPVFKPVPLPAAVWLLGSGLLGLFVAARKEQR